MTRDFTARRAVEAVLVERAASAGSADLADECARLKAFIAGVSHEMRTPLSVLIGSLPTLASAIGENSEATVPLERMQRSSRHLMEIVNDVLDASRAQAGTLPINTAVKRLGPVIDEALTDIEPQLAERRLTVTNAVSGAAADLPYVGDDLRVRQILVNLLTNAIKFTEPGGQITISGGAAETVAGVSMPSPGPWIYARVEDTGRGIPQESLSFVFEPYRQARPSDGDQGAGLGLAISRELARAMGGELTAQSEVGVGSTFTLWLPIAPSDPVPR